MCPWAQKVFPKSHKLHGGHIFLRIKPEGLVLLFIRLEIISLVFISTHKGRKCHKALNENTECLKHDDYKGTLNRSSTEKNCQSPLRWNKPNFVCPVRENITPSEVLKEETRTCVLLDITGAFISTSPGTTGSRRLVPRDTTSVRKICDQWLLWLMD